jgi:hypothetical protein
LFLESFFHAAECKYAAAVLLLSAAQGYIVSKLTEFTDATLLAESNDIHFKSYLQDVLDYCVHLASTCYINAATCMVHRAVPRSLSLSLSRSRVEQHTSNPTPSEEDTRSIVPHGKLSRKQMLTCVEIAALV